jgi:hypothetical protein
MTDPKEFRLRRLAEILPGQFSSAIPLPLSSRSRG